MDLQQTTWLALATVGVIASLSAGLGLLLYRFSSAVVVNRAVRLTGAAAIAWVFFLGTSKFYVTVSKDLQAQKQSDSKARQEVVLRIAEEVSSRAREYEECALQSGEFQCKIPADRLLKSCQSLVSQLR